MIMDYIPCLSESILSQQASDGSFIWHAVPGGICHLYFVLPCLLAGDLLLGVRAPKPIHRMTKQQAGSPKGETAKNQTTVHQVFYRNCLVLTGTFVFFHSVGNSHPNWLSLSFTHHFHTGRAQPPGKRPKIVARICLRSWGTHSSMQGGLTAGAFLTGARPEMTWT